MQDRPRARFRAIRTHFVGPTNTRGSRIIGDAGDTASKVTLEWDHRLSVEGNHAAAAVAVTDKMGWNGEFYTPLVGGEYQNSYYWVFTPAPGKE